MLYFTTTKSLDSSLSLLLDHHSRPRVSLQHNLMGLIAHFHTQKLQYGCIPKLKTYIYKNRSFAQHLGHVSTETV